MKKLTDVLYALSRYVSYFSMAALTLIMLLMTSEVVMRYTVGKPITGAFEITTVMMTILVFASWPYTQAVHGHVHVTMFVGKMPHKLRFICFGITSLLSAVVLGVATYAGYLQTIQMYNSKVSTGTLLIPHWPFMAIETVTFLLFTAVLLLDAVKALGAIGSKALAEEVESSWV